MRRRLRLRCAGVVRNPASRWATCLAVADATPGLHPRPCSGSPRTGVTAAGFHIGPGTFPCWGTQPTARVAFGGDLDSEWSGGFRGDYGSTSPTTSESVVVSGSWRTTMTLTTPKATAVRSSIGRPFFNTSLGLGGRSRDSFIVAQEGCSPVRWRPTPRLDMWGAEAYSRFDFSCTKSCRLDFIGGYSHFEINDQLAISSTTITNATANSHTQRLVQNEESLRRWTSRVRDGDATR